MLAPIPTVPLLSAPDKGSSDDALVAMWLHGKSPATQRSYQRVLDRLRAFTGTTFERTGLHDLQAFVGTLRGKATSRQTCVAAVKSFFTFANKLGAIPFNPGGMLKMEKIRDTLPDRLMTEDETERLFQAARGRDALYVRFLYASALRVGESVSLRWSDFAEVDLEEAVVTVCGKGGKTRSVRIDAGTWLALKAFRGVAKRSDRVWSFGASYARKRVRTIRERAGLELRATPHWLRHAHATHYVQNGGALDVLQRDMGHASLNTTARYLHARPRDSSARGLRLLQR